jgi:protein-tyrosine kinase
MSLIEEAARRLEQLRRAGVDVLVPTVTPGDPAAAEPHVERVPVPERLVEALESVPPTEAARRPLVPESSDHSDADKPAGDGRRSKAVHIDLEALAQAGFVTPEAQRSQIAYEFRVLKRPVIRNASGKSGVRLENGNRVMVTSALPREGKTFVALNLALSIALEVDHTVLLVDADVANPSLMKVMHLPDSKGLLDVLTGDQPDVADVLLRTNIEKLSILPAGTFDRRATEMLASDAMANLVDEMSARYPDRILVFDSPPLLPTTEARVLASHMGQILMVVEADHTTQAAVTQALETIENCPVVLMVLNKTTRTEPGGYYAYGSAYAAAD